MKSFDFIQTAPEAGDCTAPYDILFYRKMTVGEFIKEILTRNEWGYIDIYDPKDKENWYRRRGISCSYHYDELKSNFSDDILKQTIISASAHGGWTRMDYTLTLEETDKRQMDKEENKMIKKIRPIAKIRESYGDDGRAPRYVYIEYSCPVCGRFIGSWKNDTACDRCGTFYDWGDKKPKIKMIETIEWD